jgi:hypothetical protein
MRLPFVSSKTATTAVPMLVGGCANTTPLLVSRACSGLDVIDGELSDGDAVFDKSIVHSPLYGSVPAAVLSGK